MSDRTKALALLRQSPALAAADPAVRQLVLQLLDDKRGKRGEKARQKTRTAGAAGK